jgi:hypothetical protein
VAKRWNVKAEILKVSFSNPKEQTTWELLVPNLRLRSLPGLRGGSRGFPNEQLCGNVDFTP